MGMLVVLIDFKWLGFSQTECILGFSSCAWPRQLHRETWFSFLIPLCNVNSQYREWCWWNMDEWDVQGLDHWWLVAFPSRALLNVIGWSSPGLTSDTLSQLWDWSEGGKESILKNVPHWGFLVDFKLFLLRRRDQHGEGGTGVLQLFLSVVLCFSVF